MIVRIVCGVILICLVQGCSDSNKIPAPTDKWSYIESEMSDAELELQISVHHDNFGELGTTKFWLKTQMITNDVPSISRERPRLGFVNALRFGETVRYGIEELNSEGFIIRLHKKGRLKVSPKMEYDFVHLFLVSFDYSGSIKMDEVTYVWNWKKMDPNNELEPTS